jgi:hypothetical protein
MLELLRLGFTAKLVLWTFTGKSQTRRGWCAVCKSLCEK